MPKKLVLFKYAGDVEVLYTKMLGIPLPPGVPLKMTAEEENRIGKFLKSK